MRAKAPGTRLRKLVLGALLWLFIVIPAAFWAGMATGAQGPGVVVMDNVEGSLGKVTFDHETHTQMADGCASCHHTHGADNTRCSGCHGIGPDEFKRTVKDSFLACHNCHGGIDPDNPGMPSLKVALHNTCLACHRDMGDIGKSPTGCTQQCHTDPLAQAEHKGGQ